MQQIINFLIKYRNLLLYLFLLFIALGFTIQSHDYHRNTTIHSTGYLTSSLLNTKSRIYEYFELKDQNNKLSKENARLRMRLLEISDTLLGEESTFIFSDSIPYKVFPARVIKNDFYKTDNYITIELNKYGPFKGQIMRTICQALRDSFENGLPHLVEPYYSCRLQVPSKFK